MSPAIKNSTEPNLDISFPGPTYILRPYERSQLIEEQTILSYPNWYSTGLTAMMLKYCLHNF